MEALTLAHSSLKAVAGQYVGHAWRQLPDQTERFNWPTMPLSDISAPVIGSVGYLLGQYLLKKFMENRASYREPLKWILFTHNLFLTVISAYMCFGTTSVVVSHMQKVGFYQGWVDPEWRLPKDTDIAYWAYLFYISKYYELLDTAFIILKKKNTQFVQTWHHTVVMQMFWMGMETRMFAYFPLIIFNTFVHIFVYGYFVLASLNITVPWKHLVTLMQISQFYADLIIAGIWCYFRYSGMVQGDLAPFWYGVFVCLTFVYLFTNVYFDVRRRQKLKEEAEKKKQK